MIVKQDEKNNYILFRSLLIEKNYKDFLSSARITLGFDLFDKNSIDLLALKHGSNINIGMIPV